MRNVLYGSSFQGLLKACYLSLQRRETSLSISDITTHNPTLFVQLKVEPLEQWNPGPSFETYQPQRAKFAAGNSGTNTECIISRDFS